MQKCHPYTNNLSRSEWKMQKQSQHWLMRKQLSWYKILVSITLGKIDYSGKPISFAITSMKSSSEKWQLSRNILVSICSGIQGILGNTFSSLFGQKSSHLEWLP